jgi:hypothetical protein
MARAGDFEWDEAKDAANRRRAAHIWSSRAAPSAFIPDGVLSLPEGPADRAELVAEFQRLYP